jgi:hypothetical protein
MPSRSRPGFLSLILLFLWRMPSVWLGGVATALAVLLLAADFGATAAVTGALGVVAAAVAVEFAIDRRRGVGRRLLFRGPALSLRRLAALVVALSVIAGAATAIFTQTLTSANERVAEDARRRSTPDKRRGIY